MKPGIALPGASGQRFLGYTLHKTCCGVCGYRGENGLTRLSVGARSCISLAVVASLSLSGGATQALSFGAEQVLSSLGQPLRVAIALTVSSADTVESACFRVWSTPHRDGIATVSQPRIELETGAMPRLLIRSARPVDDPVLRITVESICDSTLRRDYTILLDPPPLVAPPTAVGATSTKIPPGGPVNGSESPPASASTLTSSPASPPASVAPAGESSGRRAAGAALAASKARTKTRAGGNGPVLSGAGREERSTAAAPGDGGASESSTRPRTRARSGVRSEPRDQLRVQPGAAALTPLEDASLAALAIPRLRISSELPTLDSSGPPGNSTAAGTGANAAGGSPANSTGTAGNELQLAIAKERRARLLAAPIEEDLPQRLEADLVVAQRRLAELQAQINASGGLPRTDVAAAAAPTASATAATSATTSGSPANTGASAGRTGASATTTADDGVPFWRRWLWLPASLLVLGLLAYLWRQRRKPAAPTMVTPETTGTSEALFSEAPPLPPAAGRSSVYTTPAPTPAASQQREKTDGAPVSRDAATSPARTEAPTKPHADHFISPLFQLRDTESHVDVTELSHITDEAQVFADLGRNDQAIAILRAHIDEQETHGNAHASPAPWLMIFDLYRRTHNRTDYDLLAPRFRKLFNGRMPDWDSYGHELALDDGLEAFPHLVTRIERDWGTPQARKFLEELLYDNRGGSRLGFSLAAYRDILLLLHIHDGLAAIPVTDAALPQSHHESPGANDDDGTPRWDLSLELVEPPRPGELDSFLRNMPPADKS